MQNQTTAQAVRSAKLERIRPLLKPGLTYTTQDAKLDFLTDAIRAETKIVDTGNVSSLGYDGDTLALIEKHADGLVLDCGAGSQAQLFPNVVNLEIVAYPSTDVLAVGEYLPFKDASFDAVLSIAVLEHVRDPFKCAAELVRVLKPGGDLFCAIPFLQPLHGYPHHYFNATPQGIRRLFEDSMQNIDVSVPWAGHPLHALHWILLRWSEGLDPATREQFQAMRVSDFLQEPWSMLSQPFSLHLPVEKRLELACGTLLTATKPTVAPDAQPRPLLTRIGQKLRRTLSP